MDEARTQNMTETAQRLVHELLRDVRSGTWFQTLLVDYVRAHNTQAALAPRAQQGAPAPAAEQIIRSTCIQAALLGTGAAAISTGAGVFTGETYGLGGVIAIPVASAAMLTDMLTRARVTLGMCCKIAALFDIRFDPDRPADLAQLTAVAYAAVQPPKSADDERGHDILTSLVAVNPDQLASVAGSSAVAETMARNVVPFVGLVTSGLTSYRLTRRLADDLLQYVRTRRGLQEALQPIERDAPELAEPVIEGVWFMFTSDGRLNSHEAAILAFLLHCRPADVRHALLERLRDDEAGWLERLRATPAALRPAVLHALAVAAAVDTHVPETERVLFQRISAALQLEPAGDTLDTLAQTFRKSGLAPVPATVTHSAM
ncbi:MAG: hypothetical protein RL701_5874 [Pseudomonadota bacterium]